MNQSTKCPTCDGGGVLYAPSSVAIAVMATHVVQLARELRLAKSGAERARSLEVLFAAIDSIDGVTPVDVR